VCKGSCNRCVKKLFKNSLPFGENVRKPHAGDFLTHTVEKITPGTWWKCNYCFMEQGHDKVIFHLQNVQRYILQQVLTFYAHPNVILLLLVARLGYSEQAVECFRMSRKVERMMRPKVMRFPVARWRPVQSPVSGGSVVEKPKWLVTEQTAGTVDCVTLCTLGGGGRWVDDSMLNCDWLRNITNDVL